jgi:hypothetical protein
MYSLFRTIRQEMLMDDNDCTKMDLKLEQIEIAFSQGFSYTQHGFMYAPQIRS